MTQPTKRPANQNVPFFMSKLNGQNILCVVLELLLSSELVDFMSQSESLVLEFPNCLS